MISKEYKRSYWLTLAVLLVLSAYPLVNGMRMIYLSAANGFVEPKQYAKYVIPYAAICTAIVLFAAFQPLLWRIKRGAFPIGLAGAYAVFAVVEQFFEKIQIHVTGMTLIDPASLSADSTIILPSTAVDAWQASLCIISPLTRGQSIAYASQGRYFYIMANDTYKIHYYLVSFILITMVCGLVYGIQHMIYTDNKDRKKPLILQGIATAALVALCVFANTTAFFRQPEAIQTPLASVLTCLFYVVLGAAVGVYVGSFLLRKSKHLGLGIPMLISVITVLFMYIGEAAMMEGGLYRFGIGWFFEGISGIVLAPVDILNILLSGILTWLVLHLSRKYNSWPGKRAAFISIFLFALISGAGIGISVSNAQNDDNDIFGCYEFDDCLYMNPLSSFMAATKGFMPYIYGLGEDALIIANTETGHIQQLSAQYENTVVPEDEFISKNNFTVISLPDISRYKERRLRAVFIGEGGQKYNLYQMDGEVWLVRPGSEKIGIWSIYRLKRTDKFTFSDLKYRLKHSK